jgi:ferredoxin
VEIISGKTDQRNDVEKQQLAKRLKKNPDLRLACQVKVTDSLVVRTHV